MVANKTANTMTVRGTAPMVQILEKIIQQNDKPRAEIVDGRRDHGGRSTAGEAVRAEPVGVRARRHLLARGVAERATASRRPARRRRLAEHDGDHDRDVDRRRAASSRRRPSTSTRSRAASAPPISISPCPRRSSGFSRPTRNTKLVAKPQLRGAEGTKLSLKLGDQIPIISTSYTPIATGGAGVNPLSSYQYKDIGVNIDMTPTVTLEGDILLDITLDQQHSQGATSSSPASTSRRSATVR